MTRKRNDKYDSMYEQYLTGLSLEEVGKQNGISRQSVYDGFKRRGFALRGPNFQPTQFFNDLKFSLRPTGYYELTFGLRTPMHIYVWEHTNGKVPPDHDIHHIDFNKSNNALSNLRLMTKSDHTKLHSDLLNGAANNKKVIRLSDGKVWPSVASLCRDIGTKSVHFYLLNGKPYKNEIYEFVEV